MGFSHFTDEEVVSEKWNYLYLHAHSFRSGSAVILTETPWISHLSE